MREDRLEREAEAVRWPIAIAFVLIAVAYAVLPDRLRAGPPWLLLLLLLPLIAATALSRRRGRHDIALWLGRTMTALVTLTLAISVVFLLTRLSASKVSGSFLLSSAASLWATNIGVFALWYWELDSGGPAERRPGNYHSIDFVFPQFQQDPEGAESYWLPDFVDYLFLAFNTSTAFSPTDTLVLSRRAKALMMAQSIISLIVLAVLAARAVNVL
jgi:uncharacterized membrane protein